MRSSDRWRLPPERIGLGLAVWLFLAPVLLVIELVAPVGCDQWESLPRRAIPWQPWPGLHSGVPYRCFSYIIFNGAKVKCRQRNARLLQLMLGNAELMD